MVLSRGHHVMLTRNLVYTAVTRAGAVCVCSPSRARWPRRCAPPTGRARHTRLAELVAAA